VTTVPATTSSATPLCSVDTGRRVLSQTTEKAQHQCQASRDHDFP
jgi:hypothetical protein